MRFLAAFGVTVLIATTAFGIGGSEGGNGAGSEFVPQDLKQDYKSLLNQFAHKPRTTLEAEQFVSELCLQNACGLLTEAQASEALSRFFSYQKRKAEKSDKLESKWLSRLGAGFAGMGLLIAFLAYRQSRDADRRSIRNENDIKHLQSSDSGGGNQ